jgi:hypothetical protein
MNPDRPIDLAFNKIWAAFCSDHAEETETGFCSFSQTRIAILAAVRVAMDSDDSIDTEWSYPPGGNEIVARLREITWPTEENIRHAQSAVKPALGWAERLEKLIEFGESKQFAKSTQSFLF